MRKPISILSGGEKSRVALGRVLLRKAPCLVLDEPTNHLDFATVEALTNALSAYEGTVIVVSHDRGFIKRVGTKILEVASGQVRLFPGTYEEYVWSVQRELAGGEEGERRAPRRSASESAEAQPENWKEKKKKLDKELRAVEKKLADCEGEIQHLQKETEMLNQRLASSATPSMDDVKKMSAHGARIGELEALWLELAEEKEAWVRAIAEMVNLPFA